MPDLNLQDDSTWNHIEGGEGESREEAPTPRMKPARGGGGLASIIFVVLAFVIVVGGGAFLLDTLGVIHLFGPKKSAPSVVELEEPQAAQDTAISTPLSVATQAPPIETPPLEEKVKGEPAAKEPKEENAAEPAPKEEAQPVKEIPTSVTGAKLQDMKGEFTVQVSAWRDKEMAVELVKRLDNAGYPAFVHNRQYRGSTWYAVCVGHYGSRNEAKTAVKSFAEELRSSYRIEKAK